MEFIFKDLPMDDPMQRKPVIKLAQEKLNWNPSVDLDQGLNKTIKYFQKELQR